MAVMSCVTAVNLAAPCASPPVTFTSTPVTASTVMIAITSAVTGTVHFSQVRIA
jgi:hypothetical protein